MYSSRSLDLPSFYEATPIKCLDLYDKCSQIKLEAGWILVFTLLLRGGTHLLSVRERMVHVIGNWRKEAPCY